MMRLIIARLGQSIVTLFGVSVLVWALAPLAPGDPAERTLRARGVPDIQPAQVEALRHELGLDRPLPAQYLTWVHGALRGDLGRSYVSRQQVTDELGRRAPATLLLAGGATLFAVVLAAPLALVAARYPNRWPDSLARLLALAGVSIPSFWVGLVLVELFAVRLGWTAVLGAVDLPRLVLPAATLGLGLAAMLMRILRAGLLGETQRRYALMARARGAGPWYVLVRHAPPRSASARCSAGRRSWRRCTRGRDWDSTLSRRSPPATCP
jgi:ABC-type dipeptide/oligopeptide/nickel transport system permease component